MAYRMISSREFNQDVSKAKRAASEGPVIITDRGEPSHVLMTMDEYRRLSGCQRNIAEMLAMPEAATVELDATRPDKSSLIRSDLA